VTDLALTDPAPTPDTAAQIPGPAMTVRLRYDRLVLRPHADGLLVYEFMIGGFYLLNRGARLIVETIADGLTVGEVAELVGAATDGAIGPQDVEELLMELADVNVVELQNPGCR